MVAQCVRKPTQRSPARLLQMRELALDRLRGWIGVAVIANSLSFGTVFFKNEDYGGAANVLVGDTGIEPVASAV